MARTFRRKETLGAISEINVTPLIDLAFALLIIFMITTPLLEQTIPLNLPLDSQAPASERAAVEFQVISIDREGHIYWGEDKVSKIKLNDLLNSLRAQSNPPVLNIRADRNLQYQKVIDVIDIIKQNQLSKISLDTQVR